MYYTIWDFVVVVFLHTKKHGGARAYLYIQSKDAGLEHKTKPLQVNTNA